MQSLKHLSAMVFFAIALTAPAPAQDARGSITGTVTDPQGAVVAGATVVVANTATNVANRVTTNQTGYFEVTLLNPGSYAVTVELVGFKKEVRSGLDLSVGGRLDIDFKLQLGQVAETIEVTGAAPLLETTTAAAGRVIDNKQVTELPFSDMNPFALSALAAGMQWTGQPEYRRPFDNGGTSSFNTMGNAGSNEYSIDGAPATGTGRRVGFVPSSDAVQEFKLETANFDPASGHTAGATINVSTKSGTNTYHGALFDQHWQQRWNATQHFTRLLYDAGVANGTIKPGTQKQAPGRSNQFGASFGGPVRIPKIYNGKDKLFFFFQYDGIYQAKAETTDSINRSVPKMAWRQGDFSDLLAIDATKYQIYDPRSARVDSTGHTVRTPFPGNRGIPTTNPMYKFYEPLYPKPNDVPGLVSAEGANNYLAFAMPKNEKFNSIVNRVDYNISDRHRVFGRWYWNHRLANEYDWTYETKLGLHANGLTRINKGVGGDWIWTLSGNTILDVGVNGTRFNEGSQNNIRTSYKPSDVGLPKYIDDRAGAYHELPRLDFNNVEDFSDSYPGITSRGTIGEAKVSLTTIRGSHSMSYGYNERRYWFTAAGPGNSSGIFGFDQTYMRARDDTSTASNRGLEWAAFMMGATNSMSIDTNDSFIVSTRFRSIYFKDDWRISNKFRVTYGLRYEREGGETERFNRALSGEFDASYRPPFADAVEKAYAANPAPGIPSIKVIGGTTYLGQKYKTWTDGTHHFMPRLGAVYQITPRTVLRAGYGWYYDTLNPTNDQGNPYGYNQSTSTTISTDRGLTFCCGVGDAGNIGTKMPIQDPFPVRPDGTRFDTPLQNKLGQNAREGQGWTSFRPRNYDPASQQRWRAGVQRQISSNMVVEVSYNGAWSRIPLVQKLDYLPQQYWATGNVRVQSVDDNLNTNVPNPFNYKVFPELATSDPVLYSWMTQRGFFNGTTIRRNQLLRQYPNMNGLTGYTYRGANKYHDVQVQLDKRFSKGFSTSLGYTRAYSEKKDWFMNEFDPDPVWRANNDVRPHRVVWYSIYELPFGKGRKWETPKALRPIVGGWLVSWIYQFQSGPATSWGNRFFYGDINNIGALLNHDGVNSKDIHQWFDPTIVYKGTGAIPSGFTGFEGRSANQPGSYHVRVFPSYLDVLREDGIRNWDARIKRDFRITERLHTNFAVDFLNATNHTNFSGPNLDPTSSNFGKVTSQRGLSRIIQFNLRIEF